MLNNQILVEYLNKNGIEVEILKNMNGCKCNECSLLSDIMENLLDGIDFDIEDIDNVISCSDLEDNIEGNIFESCIDCINDYSYSLYCKYCDYHGTHEIAREFVETNDWIGNTYCMESQGDAWVQCVECGEILDIDDAIYDYDRDNYYCTDCYQEVTFDIESEYVYSYHEFDNYSPKGIATDGIYFGFEMETSSDDRINSLNNFVEYAQRDFPNWDEFFHIEEDCSISGYEFISNPLSYDTLKEVIPTMTSLLKRSGFYVSSECGSHIHITRTEKSESKLFDIIMFFNNNKDFTFRVSHRSDSDKLKRWSDFYYLDVASLKSILPASTIAVSRYKTVNITNSKTIEFRFFGGTLNHQRLIANVQLIRCLLNEDINGLSSYKDLLSHKGKYPLLANEIEDIERFL